MNAFVFIFEKKRKLRGPETVRKTHSNTSSRSRSRSKSRSRSRSKTRSRSRTRTRTRSRSRCRSRSSSSRSSSSSGRSRITNRQPIAQPIAMQVLAIAQSRVNASIHKFVICFYGRLPYMLQNFIP